MSEEQIDNVTEGVAAEQVEAIEPTESGAEQVEGQQTEGESAESSEAAAEATVEV